MILYGIRGKRLKKTSQKIKRSNTMANTEVLIMKAVTQVTIEAEKCILVAIIEVTEGNWAPTQSNGFAMKTELARLKAGRPSLQWLKHFKIEAMNIFHTKHDDMSDAKIVPTGINWLDR